MAFIAALPAALGTLATAGTASTAAIASASLTLAEAGAAVGVVGAGVGAYSSIKQAQFQSNIAARNAEIAKQNADASLNAGNAAEGAKKLETGRRVGAALAAQGANGVDVGYGSPASLRGALQSEGDLDALTIRNNAASAALGYMQQSAGFSTESSLDKKSAANLALGGTLGVGASYIGGASSVASKYAKYKTEGAL